MPDPQLRNIQINELFPHPDNPRLKTREDLVVQIAAEITRNGFGVEHALLVRPFGEGYQIISGHTRKLAAERAGITEIPCWIRAMDDDEAFMQLILTNTQGEMSPLEEGHHVYFYVEHSKIGAGRGNEGGLREYCRRLNKKLSTVSERCAAYEVYLKCPNLEHFTGSHLILKEIKKAPEESWQPISESMVKNKWTIEDTKRAVAECSKFDIPQEHLSWLPKSRIIQAYLSDGRPTPSTVERLVAEANRVLAAIAAEDNSDETDFRTWLVANTGEESWEHRKITDYHINLINTWSKRREGESGIFECSARDLIKVASIEPGSVDLIFTDPPYGIEFVDCWSELGEMAKNALKPGGFLVAYSGQFTFPEALDRLRSEGLDYFWVYAIVHTGAFFRMNSRHIQCAWKPLIVMRNGDGELPNWHKDMCSDGTREKGEHEWQQAEVEADYWISELSKVDALVVDPFVGGGTTAVVASKLARRFIGGDIDANAVEATRERLNDVIN